MTQVEILDAARDYSGGYKVDASRGGRSARVSSQWFSRPADERYLSLSDLHAAVRHRSRTRTVESAAIRVEANCALNSAGATPRSGPRSNANSGKPATSSNRSRNSGEVERADGFPDLDAVMKIPYFLGETK